MDATAVKNIIFNAIVCSFLVPDPQNMMLKLGKYHKNFEVTREIFFYLVIKQYK